MTIIDIDGVAKEGDGVGRAPDGRVLFVPGALPGERVVIDIELTRKRFGRARLVEVLDASSERVEPPCPNVAAGCGGCQLQHASAAMQESLGIRIVTDAFERIGRFSAPPVRHGGGVEAFGYRTTVRCAVESGRAAFRRRKGHDLVVAGACATAHPLVRDVLVQGRFGDLEEVVVRVSAADETGMVVGSPTAEGVVVPEHFEIAGVDELRAGRELAISEVLAGRRFRVSATSFLQASPAGASLLADTVADGIGRRLGDGGHLVDLYGGIGLFAATAGGGRAVTLVEVNAGAVADAAVNLADHQGRVDLVTAPVEGWRATRADVVVADPPRRGLEGGGVAAVAGTDAELVALVSCDAAAGARDAGALAAAGYVLDEVVVLDLFPQTAHVEMISFLRRG